jgi:hypothetical protein
MSSELSPSSTAIAPLATGATPFAIGHAHARAKPAPSPAISCLPTVTGGGATTVVRTGVAHCPCQCRLAPLLSHTQRRFDSILTQTAARAAVAAHLALAALVLAHLLRTLAARPLARRILAGPSHAAVHAGVTFEDAARERAAHDARRLLLDTH